MTKASNFGSGVAGNIESMARPYAPEVSDGLRVEDIPQPWRDQLEQTVRGTNSPDWVLFSDYLSAEPGARIRAIRSLKGLSQSQLAEKAQIRQPDVSVAESNYRDAKLGILERLASALGMSLRDLLFPNPTSPRR